MPGTAGKGDRVGVTNSQPPYLRLSPEDVKNNGWERQRGRRWVGETESHEQTQSCTPAEPTAKSTVRNGQRHWQNTNPCSWPPLGSLAPRHHCDSLLQHSPWHPCSTSLPHCTPQPHGRVTIPPAWNWSGTRQSPPSLADHTMCPVPSVALLPPGAQQSCV